MKDQKMHVVEKKGDDSQAKRSMTNLKMADNFRLINYMIAEYTTSGLTDADFAVKAAEALQLPEINAGHIVHRRKEFDIPANTRAKVEDTDLQTLAATVLSQATEIASMKERIAQLEVWVNSTFPSKGPRAALG
jgi:hypothetical protein